MPGSAQAPAQTQTPGPGQFFDVPGIGGGTQWTDQFENTVGILTTPVAGTGVAVNGILPFKQTDVVVDWQLEILYAQTYTAGGSTLTNSPYAPWNAIGSVKLPIQNQYNAVDVESGIDLYFFNMVRPWRQTFQRSNLYANPAGFQVASTALGYLFAGNAQANLTDPAVWTNALATWRAILRIPASITFDKYFDLDISGNPLSAPIAAIVSPQYMAGSTRVITPQVVYNQALGTFDIAAVNAAGGAPTFAGTATTTFRRKAVYSGNPALMPPVFAWQYRWRTLRFTLAGVSVTTLQLPQDTGQLLMVYVRMFDPAANSAIGNPIQLSAVSNVQLQYGSGLLAFDGTAQEIQADFIEKHGFLPPPGVICFDLMLDERGCRTNARALNTLTTAGILVKITFTGAQSSSSYAVMGTESLVYVA